MYLPAIRYKFTYGSIGLTFEYESNFLNYIHLRGSVSLMISSIETDLFIITVGPQRIGLFFHSLLGYRQSHGVCWWFMSIYVYSKQFGNLHSNTLALVFSRLLAEGEEEPQEEKMF